MTGVHDGVGGGGARRREGVIRPLQPKPYGEDGGRHIDQSPQNEERTETGSLAVLRKFHNAVLCAFDTTDAGSDNHTGTVRILGSHVYARIPKCLNTSSIRIMRARIKLARIFFIHVVKDIETL